MSPLKVICKEKIKSTQEPFIIIPLYPSSISCLCVSYSSSLSPMPKSKPPFEDTLDSTRCGAGGGVCVRLAPLSPLRTIPGDYESVTHTLTGFPPAATALLRAWMAARGQHRGNSKNSSTVHTLHLASWGDFPPFLPGQIPPSVQGPH